MTILFIIISSYTALARNACVTGLTSDTLTNAKLEWVTDMLVLNLDMLDRYDTVVDLTHVDADETGACQDETACIARPSKNDLSCALFSGRVEAEAAHLHFEIEMIQPDSLHKSRLFTIQDKRSVIVDELERQLSGLAPLRPKRRPTVSVSSLSKVTASHPLNEHEHAISWTEAPGDPVQIASWAMTPKVIVCMRSLFSESRVREAFAYWERMGYHFESVLYDSLQSECHNGDFPLGAIIITDDISPVQDYYLARTFLQISEKRITSARIEVKTDSRKKAYLLEHEIGHALGWNHATRVGHLMCAEYAQMLSTASPVIERIEVQRDW